MGDSTQAYPSAQLVKKSRKGLWWGIGSAALVLVVAVAAVIIVPRVIHAQRVAEYIDLVAQTNVQIAETDRMDHEADRATVLFALQFEEVEALLTKLDDLAGLTDHYFTDEDRAALATVSTAQSESLAGLTLNESETVLADTAKALIEDNGIVWQTDFLNMSTDVAEALLAPAPRDHVVPVPDEQVTSILVEQEKLRLTTEQELHSEAEAKLALAEDRLAALTAAAEATLAPLKNAAASVPAQAGVVLGMYPNAEVGVAEVLRESARLADAAIAAEQFTQMDGVTLPITGEPQEGQVAFTATDAWRAAIIANHLKDFAGAVTASWITDAGGVEQALGFNPYAPFF